MASSVTTSSSSSSSCGRLVVAALAALGALAILFPPPAVTACSCMPTHPQEHYCNADYVIIARVLRQRQLPHSNVYKIAIKKSYKMNERAAEYLREGKLSTAAADSMCGRPLAVGKVYVIAGSSTQVSLCSYAQPYAQMTQVEKRGFAGGYRKGCACEISMQRFGAAGQCEWSPWEECETRYGACVPSRGVYNETSRPSKCHWRSSPLYNECRNMP